jgi:membrane-bound lytic murein transglycosylase F
MQKSSIIIRTITFLFIVFSLFSCRQSPQNKHDKNDIQEIRQKDTADLLDTIFQRKKLIAITDYGSTNYFIYRGQPMGYQYEMVQKLGEYLGVGIDLRIERDLDSGILKLQQHKSDLIAMTLTVTSDRMKKMDFTEPFMFTRQVLVQRKPDNYRKMATADQINKHLIRNILDLGGKTIYVQKGTIFVNRLKTLENEIADTINIVEDEREMEQLIEAVANKEIDYTIADEMVAKVAARIYPNIDVKMPVSFHQKIAWAVPKNEKRLLDTINSWIRQFNKSLESRLLYNKYFKNIRTKRIVESIYNSYAGGNLSPYDEYIKEASKLIGWDWRLLASMIYQESEFKPNVKSWVGAYGLMQLMPAAMEKYGIDTNSSVKDQIFAGVKLLKQFDRLLPDSITDSVERIKFILASYNVGVGHILDARRLALKYGKNPNVWDDNVDYFILHLSEKKYYHDPVVRNGYARGWETYAFVKEILQRYEHYKKLIPD